MTLALSDDAGLTWPIRRNIEVGDGYCLSNNSRDGLNREFSYPTITAAGDALHIAFTRFRQAIEYVEVTPEWIERNAVTNDARLWSPGPAPASAPPPCARCSTTAGA